MSLIERFFPIHRPDFFFFDNSRFDLFDFDAEFMKMKAEMESMHELMDRQFGLMRNRMFSLTPMEFPLCSDIVEIRPTNPFVTVDGETKLKLDFNVQGFKPEEVEVKIIGDNVLQVIAKSVETTECSERKRHHMSQYTLPAGVLADKIKPVMSKDGVLTIEAPSNC